MKTLPRQKLLVLFLFALLCSSITGLVASAKSVDQVVTSTSTATPTVTSTATPTIFADDKDELIFALAHAQPGDVIQLKAGVNYEGNFIITTSGTINAPITLQGPESAVLYGNNSTSNNYVLHLNGGFNRSGNEVNYWHFIGFSVTHARKGIVLDNANYNIIDNLSIHDIDQEGVHFRAFSSHNTLQYSTLTKTGIGPSATDPGYGEGVYIGSDQDAWPTYTGGQADTSDYNRVLHNTIGPDVSAEAVDIKEATTGGEVSWNTFNQAGMSGQNSADSWVDVKGNYYLISNNTGSIAKQDGFQTNIKICGWGNYNTFSHNTLDVQAPGFGFNIKTSNSIGSAKGNLVYDDNVVTSAAAGVTNITLVSSTGASPTPASPPVCAAATATQTQTATPNITSTQTATSTAISTLTVTRTITSTAIATNTITPTQFIPTLTPTSTLTATATATNTVTLTATATATPTLLATQTVTRTLTVTAAAATSTVTKTKTPTYTPTATATRTPLTVVVTFQSSAAQDGWVLESTETSGVGGTLDSASTTFRLGNDATDKQYRGILHFDTSSLPDTATITSVTLKIKRLTSAGTTTNPFTLLGGLRVDLAKPYFGTSASLVVGDFSAAATSVTVSTFGATPVSGAWYAATLNTAGMNNLNLTGPTQFRLHFTLDDNDNMTADYFGFYTGNTSAISDRPQLTVTYSLP